jgi:hypothetical protein
MIEAGIEAAAKALYDLVWAKYPGTSNVPHIDKPEYETVRDWFMTQARVALAAAEAVQ